MLPSAAGRAPSRASYGPVPLGDRCDLSARPSTSAPGQSGKLIVLHLESREAKAAARGDHRSVPMVPLAPRAPHPVTGRAKENAHRTAVLVGRVIGGRHVSAPPRAGESGPVGVHSESLLTGYPRKCAV